MKNLNPKAIVLPAAVLAVICTVIAALLAGTNTLTREPIAQQAKLKAQQARELVLPQAASFQKLSTNGSALENIPEESYFALNEKEEIIGFTITTAAKGYGGDIQVMVGIDSISGTVSGVSILSQNETPGLGANAVNEAFTGQYKQPVLENGFSVIKNAAPKDGEIQAITGATITSKAVTDAVNEALSVYQTELAPYDGSLKLWKTVLADMQTGKGGGN